MESAADLLTWNGVVLQACVDHVHHNYLLDRNEEYGNRV